ncbi:MAG: Holliday junction branch migration protein RuvA [Lachnospiraceae bacterium]|nr:Holliday junction branch migration protein RuvA [Lachnospiraceae bacterium]
MIAYIKGELVSLSENQAVIENNGMGFAVNIPSAASFGSVEPGMSVKVYTYMNVREDDISLFGFISEDDLEMFKMLIGVSGIGPKNALSILSALNASDLRVAIISGDAKAISNAPGVGKKSAERVILELKDKIDIENVLGAPAGESVFVNAASPGSGVFGEVVEALVSMGASDSEAFKAARAVPDADGLSVDEYLKAALKLVKF